MTKRRVIPVVQMYEDKWYLDKFTSHVCCECSAEHITEYKVENGRIFTRWRLDEKATAANRKKLGIKVTTKIKGK